MDGMFAASTETKYRRYNFWQRCVHVSIAKSYRNHIDISIGANQTRNGEYC